jgi:bifunctional enzyme CysN/CysC
MTCGSVDDGKSTLLGRLLHDVGAVAEDQLAALARDSRRHGTRGEEPDFGLLLDGLEAEREQGVTIDVAYRYFATERRNFIVADAPGHEQYTRNMAVAASVSDLAVVLVDARKGLLPQTRRHAHVLSLFGVGRVVVAVNKMDTVGWDEGVFAAVQADWRAFAAPLRFTTELIVPVSAPTGDNVARRSSQTPWYSGATLLDHLERAEIRVSSEASPLRLAVQTVIREGESRGLAGTIAGGALQVGEAIASAAGGPEARVTRLLAMEGDATRASAGEAVTVWLDRPTDVARGDLLCDPARRPQVADQFAAHLLWLGEHPLLHGRPYLLKIGPRCVVAQVTTIRHRVDPDDGRELAADTLELNDIGVCNLSTASPIAFDPYAENRTTGAFILIDRITQETVGAGMIDFALRRATNIRRQDFAVGRAEREQLNLHRAACVWLTGLSGSGKSTIADLVERELHARDVRTYLLDGDNLRHGLNRDLGFTEADRVENLRRAGEVARLMVDAGAVVICAFISPFRAERRMIRELFDGDDFIEVFVDAPFDVCAERDPKGLYAKAARGEIRNFTGVDSPYEPPEHADLVIDTSTCDADTAARAVLDRLEPRLR